MRLGKLKRSVAITQKVAGKDAAGQPNKNFVPFLPHLYAFIQPKTGQQRAMSGAIQNPVTHEVTIRYRVGILPSMRVEYGTRYFDIINVLDTEEEKEWLVLECIEGANRG